MLSFYYSSLPPPVFNYNKYLKGTEKLLKDETAFFITLKKKNKKWSLCYFINIPLVDQGFFR